MAQSDMVMMVVEDGSLELQEMFTKQKEQDLVPVGLLVMLWGEEGIRRGFNVCLVELAGWCSEMDQTRAEVETNSEHLKFGYRQDDFRVLVV